MDVLIQRMSIQTSFWCERVQTCFSMFSKNPRTLQHLLLFGPPGSGKTTSAAWLVDRIWGNRKSLMCISMNAADERSLESIRQKVFPFLRVDWRTETETAPRFLVLDECETLTEAAQLSLQTMLNTHPQQICVILICNSQSRIHPKLRQRLLKIRYDPPQSQEHLSTMVSAITRGDLRQHGRTIYMEHRLWKYLHAHPSQRSALIHDEHVDEHTIVTELLLLSDMFHLQDSLWIARINMVYSLLVDDTIPQQEVHAHLIELIREYKQKFETKWG